MNQKQSGTTYWFPLTFLLVLITISTILLSALIPTQAQDDGAQATIDAAVQQAFTQTAEAAAIDPAATQSFQQTVQAAINQALTATAVALTPAATVSPAAVIPTTEPVTSELSERPRLTLENIAALGSGQILTGHEGAVTSVDVNNAGIVATGSEDNTMRLWSAASGTPIYTYQGDAPVLGVRFAPDNETLVITDANGTITIFNLADNIILNRNPNVLADSEGAVIVNFNPDGSQIVIFDFNGTLRFLSYPDLNIEREVLALNFGIPHFETDTLTFASRAEPNVIRVTSLTTGEDKHVFPVGGATYVEPVAYDETGNRLLFAADDQHLYFADLDTGESAFFLTYEGYGLAQYSPSGDFLIEGGLDGKVRAWDAQTAAPLVTLDAHNGGVSEVAISPDGSLLVSGGQDATAHVWQLNPDVSPSLVIGQAESESVTEAVTPLPDGFPPQTEATVQIAEQVFENGRMMWVEPVNQIWVMTLNDEGQGQWLVYGDNFDAETDVESDPSIVAPDGLIQPVRGFGKLWRENPEVRDALGWAITPEFGYISRYRYVPGGEIVDGTYSPGPGFHVLFSLDGEAFRFEESTGTWHLGD